MTDEILETSKSTSIRRPMTIETEVRTDTITRRRVGSTTSSRSVHEILQNTKSPTDGLPPTTYTYAHSVSYMPVTQSGSYDVPVMARRDLHGSYTSINSGSHSILSSPTKFIHNVGSQLVNSYSSIRNRFSHSNQQQTQQQQQAPSNSFLSSPTTRSNTRSTRSSTLRSNAPVHSTPREIDTKLRKTRKSQEEEEQHQQQSSSDDKDQDAKDSFFVQIIKRIVRLPFDIASFVFRKFFGLPWWLLIPLLLVLGFYALPNYACKPFEHYPESKLYQNCVKFQQYVGNVTTNTTDYAKNFLENQAYNRVRSFGQQICNFLKNIKHWIVDKFDDIYVGIRKFFQRNIEHGKEIIGGKKDDVQAYCDAGLAKVRGMYDDLKKETEKFLSTHKPALKPYQAEELEALVRQVMNEYAADETGEADYALEANGGKIVDTRCTEYTDEPRQNVVKFLGIPIVHMSKQPNIMIKAGRMPGQCFPFKGDQGSVIIKLAVPVRPTEFAVEHLSKSISIVGHINSAPNNFTVYALKDKNDREGLVLGRYSYDAENGPSLQRFKPQLQNVPLVEYVEVRVTSNWGNPNYTCLYRFRVHGSLQSAQPSAPPAA